MSKRPCLDVPCEKRCYCADGFARIDGVCVSREKCNNDPPPMDCKDPNSSYNSCGSACEPICGKVTPLFCAENCVAGCFCKDGFIKDSTGVCIPIEKCPKTSCDDPNAEYTECGSKCNQPKCSSIGLLYKCLDVCEVGCFCKKGFLLDDQGKCVEKCPVKGKN